LINMINEIEQILRRTNACSMLYFCILAFLSLNYTSETPDMPVFIIVIYPDHRHDILQFFAKI
jgi:hypothetical protein